jgi:hypothetical protein
LDLAAQAGLRRTPATATASVGMLDAGRSAGRGFLLLFFPFAVGRGSFAYLAASHEAEVENNPKFHTRLKSETTQISHAAEVENNPNFTPKA